MKPDQKIAALLAQARDITKSALGSAQPAVVAEVFRALWLDAGETQHVDDPTEDVPHALH